MHARIAVLAVSASLLLAATASAATIYDPGLAPAASGSVTFGTHLTSGIHTSVAGVGGSGFSPSGSVLDGGRTYTYDLGGGPDLADGIANRGNAGFAMMIWDFTTSYNSLRLYTHQDHYSGGPITTTFVAQDVMEYSVWGSHNGDDFVLLSDVTAFNLIGGGAGLPTYTFNGTAPSIVYRGGSTEFGVLNAYTREYVFGTAYRYYGIRTSYVSLVEPDADPEIDAIAAFNIEDRPPGTPGTGVVPLPPAGLMGLSLLAGVAVAIRRRRRR